MLSTKVLFTKILTALAGKVDKSSFSPMVLRSATTNAPSTQNDYTTATVSALADWNAIAVRCRVQNAAQQLIFVRGIGGESYLVYTDASGNVSRGGFAVNWSSNQFKVRWTHGSNANVYAESIYGILRKP